MITKEEKETLETLGRLISYLDNRFETKRGYSAKKAEVLDLVHDKIKLIVSKIN